MRPSSVRAERLRHFVCGALALSVLACASGARAQVPFSRIAQRLGPNRLSPGLVDARRWVGGAGTYGSSPRAVWLPVSDRHWVVRVPERELGAFATEPGLRWSPPRHLLMDRARATLRLEAARASGAGTGQGVVIGIVDSGVDITHPDLRQPDGSTRLAWSLDFASNPLGLHPELESALGCQPEAGLRCQVLGAADLNERLGNDVIGDEPLDTLGHGTIVAAIAAGNGAFGGGANFAGVAPEATLIAARVTGAVGTITDSDVVLATKFVFERAAELGMPAVVNLSLGSDFGAHDGSSELSEALAELVGPEWPGRVIVVAGGNSGELHEGVATGWPGPFGLHAEVAVTPDAPVRVPLVTPYPLHGRDTTDASLFIWVDLHSADALSVGISLPDGARLTPVSRDQSDVLRAGELVAGVIHGIGADADQAATLGELPDLPLDDVWPSSGAAVIVVDGRWPAGNGFFIDIEGRGQAELWVQSEGDLAPEAGSVGALFAAATARSTVTIPAVHPELIAVGASVDRLEWNDATGALASVQALPVTPTPELGSAAFFSSAGPSSTGGFKPDLLAPGAFVISAMAAAADPRRGGIGIFSGGLCAGAACQVVSDGYALTAGTSMAAPMVSGAVALLLERQASLTQEEVRGLLVAGSAALEAPPDVVSREGSGLLDVARSVQASSSALRGTDEHPSSEQSRLRAARDAVWLDPTRPLSLSLWLRDASGAVFDAGIERLAVRVLGGELQSAAERVGPGLYRFSVAAPSPAPASLQVDVVFDAEPWLSLALPIEGGDDGNSRRDDGGCALTSPGLAANGHEALGLAALGLWVASRARRRR
jgi:subtilisin family serine protease